MDAVRETISPESDADRECCGGHGIAEEESCCGHHGGHGEHCCGGAHHALPSPHAERLTQRGMLAPIGVSAEGDR